ncbi:MAG TPA: hypothetical protein VFB84_02500 [Micromonosporaceae bacterium]|nr:hypothetical protein [Micromonosporaceae bacterium]
MSVRVILDTSALLSYARLSGLAVGELVAMVEEDGGAALVGVPAASFLAAYSVLDKDERSLLVDLATKIDGVTTILPLLGADAVEVAGLDARLGAAGLGHAVVEARRRGSLLATYAGSTARWELPDGTVLDL